MTDLQSNNFFSPNSFSEALFLHLFSNFLPIPQSPLLLGIHGPPGHGKSFQIEKLLSDWSVHASFISGSQLESDSAGEPTQLIRQHYRELGQKISETKKPAALVIDDIDAGIGDFGKRVTYTVNRQNVSSALMNLCDRPELLKSTPVKRVPIIVTANDINTLYEPLRRPSRMQAFHWVAQGDDLKQVVRKIFFDLCEADACDQLVESFPNESPAFFRQVATLYIADLVSTSVVSYSKSDALRFAVINPTPFLDSAKSILNDGKKDAASALGEIAQNLKEDKIG